MLPLLYEAERERRIPASATPETIVAMLVGAVSMPLLMRSVALPDIDTAAGRVAFFHATLRLGPKSAVIPYPA